MKSLILFLSLFFLNHLVAQVDYFPPVQGEEWETLSMEDLGWCDDELDELLAFHEANGTKAFLVLKDGKIVIEEYFQGFESDMVHQWNSAGKTITAMLIGIAQENGLLSIYNKSSDYLGPGWTSLPSEKEDLITVRNQLTMTTGLDDTQFNCLDSQCLTYLEDAGNRWAYHNAPYTLLTNVIENVSGQSLNVYTTLNLNLQTGINGAFVNLDSLQVFFSRPRGMARMGLLMLNQGIWDGTTVLSDMDYYNALINTSQNINEAYGYLWWLNGTSNFMLPATQFVFPGMHTPNAPADLYAGIGKNGQFLDVVPSENLVVIRMGDSPGGNPVPIAFHDEMWSYLSEIICESTPVQETIVEEELEVYPNPASEFIRIHTNKEIKQVRLFNTIGNVIHQQTTTNPIPVKHLPTGIYGLEIVDKDNKRVTRRVLISKA